MKKAILIFSCILFFSNILHAGQQKLPIKYPLTEEDIKKAIYSGLKRKPFRFYLQDEWAAIGSEGATGFSIELLTPFARISNAAYEAKRKYMNFTREDVTEEMLAPVLLIIVNPSTPKRLIAKDTQFAQSVEHVVLADITKRMIIQPSAIEFFEKEAKSGMGAEFVYQGAYVEFPIEELIKVSNNDPRKGEFYIKIIGSKSEKEFKIKEKHLSRLW